MHLLRDLPKATSGTPDVTHPGKFSREKFVGEMTMPNEFDTEEPTKPEVTETLVETLERLRSRTSTARDRPAVRSKHPTENPAP